MKIIQTGLIIAMALVVIEMCVLSFYYAERGSKIETLKQEKAHLESIVRCQNDTILKAKERLKTAIY